MQYQSDQRGQIDPLVVPLSISVIVIVGLAIFGLWSFISLRSEQSSLDERVAAAVLEAEQQKAAELEVEFEERSKLPNKTFIADSAVGSLSITYPKTWSGIVKESSGQTPLDATFHPDYVPDSANIAYALRVQVVETDYEDEVAKLQSRVEKGVLSVRPLVVAGEKGLRYDGELKQDVAGSLVLLPLRDKTIKVWTESEAYRSDFTNTIVKNLDYEP